MTLPNGLSFFRLLLGLIVPYLVLKPFGPSLGGQPFSAWLALGLFILGTLSDYWDGWLARYRHEESPLGRILDPLADKILVLGTMASFASLGIFSRWLLVPIFFREIAVTICRFVWLKQGQAVGAERAGKIKLGFQVASVLAAFLYLMAPQGLTFYLNQFVLIVALGLTLYSGYFFFKNNRRLLETREFARSIATMGVGTLGPFPGTYGTLLGLVLVLLVAFDTLLYFFVFLIVVGLGYWSINQMKLEKDADPLEVVIDEAAGILLAFFTVPLRWEVILAGFIAFRFFDVTKIFPVNWFENKKGTHGIMLDDLMAGVYTWLVLRILFW